MFSIDKNLQQAYDGYYEDPAVAAWRRLTSIGKARNIARFCGPIPHARILEIGCGEGAILERLSETSFGEQLFGLEISRSGVEATLRKEIPSLDECQLFDGDTVPYGDAEFDVAILSHVVEHLEYPRRLLHEAGRVARHTFVEVPLEDNLQLHPDPGHDTIGHLNFFNPKTIRKLMHTCGFEVLRQRVVNSSWAVYRHIYGLKGLVVYLPKELLLRALPPLAPRMLTYHCALLGRSRAENE